MGCCDLDSPYDMYHAGMRKLDDMPADDASYYSIVSTAIKDKADADNNPIR